VKALAAVALAVVHVAGFVAITVAASAVSVQGGSPVGTPAITDGTAQIPSAMLSLYQEASSTCPGLPWTVLAAIGTIESDNGESTLPGVHSGVNSAGAEGPMQFLPSTFAAYSAPVPPGGADPASAYDAVDAVYAAARLICANGGAGGTDLADAVFAYNHSSTYVAEVLTLAQGFATVTTGTPAETGVATPAGGLAVAWALAQIGTPYVWGGETPGVGFDCSGLVQAAYRAAGVALPRVAQAQYDATTKVAPSTALAPGDLVFFGHGSDGIDHVGLFVGLVGGRPVMVDAPHAGADVRAEYFLTAPGAAFGSMVYVGATRP